MSKITRALALIAALAAAPTSLASPVPASAPAAHHIARRDDGRLQGVYLKTWEGGWSYAGIQNMFTSLIGKTDIIYVTFFQPTAAGLDCPSQSPCASVYSQTAGADVPASHAYKAGIEAAQAKGIRTLLSIGGWSYRDDFAFLAGMGDSAIAAWAQSVKKTVDSFGAHGIDIDYEAQTADQWQAELVKTNLIGHLRQAMPASHYVISLTIGGIAAAAGTPQEVQAAFSPALSTAYPLSGVALPTIKQNYADIDLIQLMTYDGEPNFNPMVCMDLTVKALSAMGAASPASKLLVGAELGGQFGSCNGVTEGWCDQDLGDVQAMANDVVQKGYRGLFYWPNIDGSQYYAATYPSM